MPNTDFNLEAHFLPMISDYGFKVTFGNEKNTLFLRTAIQALIKSEVPITYVEFYKNTIESIVRDGRSGILDLACKDARGNHFIVEMQLEVDIFFIQRLKFYGFHKFITLSRKGAEFDFSDMPLIYVIGFLGENIYPYPQYHQVGMIRNEEGDPMDTQIKFITVELNKFTLPLEEISTNLEKLIYTMKMAHTITEPIQYPQFWTEEWLHIAMEELATRNLTPDERFAVDRTMAINSDFLRRQRVKMQEAERVGMEKGMEKGMLIGEEKGIEKGILLGEEKGIEKGILLGEEKGIEKGEALERERAEAAKTHTIREILKLGKMSAEDIALTFDVPLEFVQKIVEEQNS